MTKLEGPWPPALRQPGGLPWQQYQALARGTARAPVWRSGGTTHDWRSRKAAYELGFGHLLAQALGVGPWVRQVRFDPWDLADQVRAAIPPMLLGEACRDDYPTLEHPTGYQLLPGAARRLRPWDRQAMLYQPSRVRKAVEDDAEFINSLNTPFRADVLPPGLGWHLPPHIPLLLVYSRRWALSPPK